MFGGDNVIGKDKSFGTVSHSNWWKPNIPETHRDALKGCTHGFRLKQEITVSHLRALRRVMSGDVVQTGVGII